MTIFATHKLINNGTWPTRGVISYHVADDGRTYGRVHLGTGIQQSGLWETPRFHSPRDLYLAANFRFPRDFTWANPAYRETLEHKLLIGDTANERGQGRLLVNLRGSGSAPHLQAYVQGFDTQGFGGYGRIMVEPIAPWPLDGLWHRLEAWLTRDESGVGRLRIWLDDRVVCDATGSAGTAPFIDAQFGAYVNQGSARPQFFDVGDLIAADVRTPFIVVPVPPDRPPTPPSDREALARDIDDLVRRTQDNVNDLVAIAKRLRAQGA